MSIIELRRLTKSYGTKAVLCDANLSVAPGDFTVIFGLPNSGKSVLVRLLTGLESPDSGQILLRGADVTALGPGGRNIGYVPQAFALYPHFTVRQNISYPLDLAGVPRAQVEPEVQRVAGLLGIAELLDRKPDQLSGGQKQRVAVARGLVKQTDVYVLDDPLAGLDFKLRERLIDDLRRTQEVLKATFVYITSDAVEALMLARTLAVLSAGEIVESGPPERLYHAPARAETMRYVAFPHANFFRGMLGADGARPTVRTPLFEVALDGDGSPATGDVEVAIRPEKVRIGGVPGGLELRAQVLLREDLGGEDIVYCDVDGHHLTTVLRADEQAAEQAEIDQIVTIGFHPADLVVFANRRRIGCGAPL
jgi:ABC-type sugar transport system ATPase subunit